LFSSYNSLKVESVKTLQNFSQDMWKFLVAVCIFDVVKTATKDDLDGFFASFPTAEVVEDSGWFDVDDYLRQSNLHQDDSGEFRGWPRTIDNAGKDEGLARTITNTAYYFIENTKDMKFEFSRASLKKFPRANKFWEQCYEAVFE
jgi:hypothetical protein